MRGSEMHFYVRKRMDKATPSCFLLVQTGQEQAYLTTRWAVDGGGPGGREGGQAVEGGHDEGLS